ncbi:MAG: 4-oxalomesaconate tautomerase, partial [Microbacterium sp.]|nr:4-oxalomesaconate tautomerase [Microbacterium sp.]
GAIATRAFIPTRVHTSIGVLMAASVAAALRIPGTVGAELAVLPDAASATLVEHQTGVFPARVSVEERDGAWYGTSVSERTARKIFDGTVFPRPRL